MEPNSPPPIQRTSRQLTLAFVVAYVVGIALIAWNPLAPCIPLIAYAVLGFLLTRDQRNSDRFADSLYYLGFLLTLTALFIALREISDKANAMSVARTLGAGLAASILGLGLRVLVVQFRGTVSDQEEETREAIEEQAAKVKHALELLESGWTHARAVIASLGHDLEEFRNGLNHLHSDTLKTAQERHTRLLESSASAAQAWDQQIQHIRDSLARVEIPPTLAREAFAQIAKDLGQAAAQVVGGAARTVEEMAARLDAVSGTTTKCRDALENLSASLIRAVAATNTIGEATASASSSVADSSGKFSAALSGITNQATNLSHSAAVTSRELGTAASAINAATQSLQTAVSALGQAMPALHGLQGRIENAVDAVARVEPEIRASVDNLVKDVKQSSGDLAEVRHATGELVELVRSELARPK